LPFAVAFGVWGSGRNRWLVGFASLVGIALLVALGLTASRAAWLALLAVLLLVALVFIQRKWFRPPLQLRLFWAFCLLLVLLGLILLYPAGMLTQPVEQLPDTTGSLQSRFNLWQQGTLLIGDYAYTGSGLMGFCLVYIIFLLLPLQPFRHIIRTFLYLLSSISYPLFLSVHDSSRN